MSLINPTKIVAENVCGPDEICGPESIESALACSPIGYGADPNNGWLFRYAIVSVTFWGPECGPDKIRSLSKWIPATLTYRLCPPYNKQNEEPNPYYFVSNWFYFSSVNVPEGPCSNTFRVRSKLTPINARQVNLEFYIQGLTETGWQSYSYFSNVMTENPNVTRKKYQSRGYLMSQDFLPISVNPDAGGGAQEVSAVTMVCGVIPFLESCGTPCQQYNTTTGGFMGCANGVMYSKNSAFVPYPFLIGRNASPCGTAFTAYCYCDSIELTSISPVEGKSENNAWRGPDKNDFVQMFGYTGLPGEVVGARQEIQIGVAQGQYVIIKVINEGQLNFGTKDAITGVTTWGGSQIITQGNPTIVLVDRPDFYIFIYLFPFPNLDILPNCSNNPTTPYPELPTSTTAYPFPASTTSTTSTTCRPGFGMYFSDVDVPPELQSIMTTPPPETKRPVRLTPEQARALIQRQKGGCGCGKRS